MPLESVLPIVPGANWSSTVSNQVQEIITTYNAEELDALAAAPSDDIAWANQGTNVSMGLGIVKIPVRLPQSLGFQPFEYGGQRVYQNIDIAAPIVKVQPWQLNFAWPIVWDELGNASLMSQGADGTLDAFMGSGGLATAMIMGAMAYKAQLVATMFYRGYTKAALGMTATIKTIPQPGLPNGNDFFVDGTGAEGSGQARHYAHPFRATSGRFQNAYPAFGAFAANFGASMLRMRQKPHPTLPNMTMGLQVTDVIGPTYMLERFWAMAVQSLHLQTATVGGTGVAAATTAPYAADTLGKWNQTNFTGASGFAPVRYWIAPQLDNHPYYTANSGANLTSGPGGQPADMWINVSAQGRGSWCYLGCGSKDFVPYTRLYGPGDPRSQSERRVRLEGDLDAGVAGGLYHFVDMFFGV